MARLNTTVIDSDDELPDVSILLAPRARNSFETPSSRRTREFPQDESQKAPVLLTGTGSPRRQRSLKLIHVNSLLLPLASELRRENGVDAEDSVGEITGTNKKREQQHRVAASENTQISRKGRLNSREIKPGFYFSDEDISDEDSMSDFIVDDSASDLEVPVPRSPRKNTNNLATRPKSPAKSMSKYQAIDPISPEETRPTSARPVTPPEAASQKGAFREECLGRLRL